MSQPDWKLIYSTGSEALYVDATGVYDPELDTIQEYETERDTTRFLRYRFDLPRCQLTDGKICDNHGTEEWFSDDLDSIALSADHATIREDLCSEDPRKRAHAYGSIAGHWGYDNFDGYPQDLNPLQVASWPDINLDSKMSITISTNDDDDGSVTVTCDDSEAARDDQSIEGFRWEFDGDFASTSIMNRPGLVAAFELEGYDVDSSDYHEPDAEDLAFWHAKYERSNGAPPESLRTILGWHTIADVKGYRVTDQVRYADDGDRDAFLQACFDAGFVLVYED